MFFKKATAVLLAVAVLFGFSSCKNAREKNGDRTINFHLSEDPKTLDPQIASDSDSNVVIPALFEGLARLDKNGGASPGVAQSWKSNADGSAFTFSLRKDARWSNKSPVTAGDFVYAFRRALSPETGSKTCSQMFCIKNARKVNSGQMKPEQLGVSALDDHTLSVELEYPYPNFPELTASPVFMPCKESFFTGTAGRYGLENDCVLGNGPFEIDGIYGWEHGKYLNLARSDTYSGEQKVLPSNLDFSIGSSENVSDPVAAMKNEAVDAIAVPTARISDAAAAGCTLSSCQDTVWGLCFNTNSVLMKNVNIRRAFLQAFDRSKVLAHLPKDAAAAEYMQLPSASVLGLDYRSNAGGPFYLKQDKNAYRLLAAGLKELGLAETPSVGVLCPDDPNVKLMLNEMIVMWNSQFRNYFNMEVLSESELLSRVKAGSFQIALFPITPESNTPSAVLSRFASSSPDNVARYKSSAYDSLLASAEIQSGGKAVSGYAAAEKYLSLQGVFYPLYYEKHYYAMAKGVSGILFHPFGGGIDFIRAGKD